MAISESKYFFSLRGAVVATLFFSTNTIFKALLEYFFLPMSETEIVPHLC